MYRRVVLALWVLVTCGWISQSAVAQSNESLLFIKPGSMLDQRLIPANNDLLVLNDKCTINQHNGKVTDISRCPAGIYNYESKVKKNTINNKVINDIESLIKTTQKDISDEQSNKEERCRPYQVEETVWSWQLLWGWYYIYWPSVEQVTKKICSDEVKNPKLVIQLQQALEVAIKIRDTLNSITNSHYGYDHLITNFGYDIQALEKHYESLTDVLESSKRNELIAQLQELLSPPIPQVYRIAVHQGHAIMEFKGISTDENTLQYQLACPLVSDSPQPILEETLNIGGKWTNNNPSAGYSDIDKFYKSNPTYVFTVKESVTLQIDLGYDGTYIDTYLSIRDVENSTRYEDDDGGDGRNSRITQQFAPGVYEIAAGTYSNMQIGAFKLKIEKVSKDGTVFLSRSTSNVSDNSQNLCDQLVPTNSRVSIISSQTEEVYQANISFSKAERKEGWLDIAIDLRQKLYTLQTNHNSQYKVLLQASFGQVHQNGSNVIELRSLNRAPVLTNLALAGITDEDTAYNIPIVQLLQDAGVQYEAKEPRRGIYINSNTGRGSWEYCQSSSCQKILNNSWLRADNDSRLRYQPDGKNGETAQLTFSAWDQSDQTMGSVSTQTARLILDVNDINDPVTISTNGFFMPMTEDQWSELKVAQTSIKFEDPDSDDSDQYFLTLEVSAGHLRYTKQELSLGEQEGSKIILSGSLSQLQQAIQSSIQYKHLTEHYFGEDQLTLTLSEEKDRYSSAQQDYSITINPVNDLPKFASSANSKVTLTIDENQSTGHVVANHPTASDVDGDVLTYQLRGENGAFSIVGGNIVANQSLDYESKALYKLILEAVDAANGVALIDIEIDVNDINDPVTISTNGFFMPMTEDQWSELKVAQTSIKFEDPDSDDSDQYFLTLEVSAGHLRYTKQELSLGEQEGSKIILSGSLSQLQQAIQSSIQYKHLTEHYFGEDQLTLTLSEEKDRYSSAQQDYSITINPVNDLPKFASSANSKVTLTIDENQSTGHVVANHPTASDVDGDVLTYQLRGENGAFSIVGGNIVANQSLDYESKALYKLILEAVDAANGVALIDIEIDVNNLLEKPIATTPNPGLIKDSVSGDKLETKNISFVLIVNDPDKNDTLTYSIQGQSDNKLKGVYGTLTVDSKEGIYTYVPFEKTLDTINGLSFNQSQTDTFTLVVKDDAGLTDSTNYKVNLINQNNPPGVRPPECFTQAGNKPVDDLFDDGKYQCEVEINDPDTQTTSWGLSVNGINPQNTKYSNKQRFSYQPSRRDDENDFIVTVTDGTHQVSTKLPVKHTFAKTSGLIKGRLAAGEINSGLDNDILKWDAHRNKVKLNLTLAPGEVCSRDVTLNSKPVDMLLLDINGDTLDDWLVFHNSSDGTLVKTYINKASNQNTGNNWNSSKCYWPFYKTPDFERKIQFKGLSGVKGVEGRQKRNDADRQVQYLLLHSDVHGQTQVLALVHSIKSNHENAKIQELKVVKSSIRKPQTQHILAADLSFLGSHHWSLMEGMHNSDAVAVAEVVIDKDEISSSDQSINFSDLKFQRTSYKLEKGKLVRNAIDLKLGSQHNWRVLKNTENSSAPKFSLINTNPEESSTQATFMPRNISVLWADLPQYSHPILMYSTEPDAFLTKSVDVHVNDNALLLQDKTKFSQHKNSTGIDYQKNFWVLNIPAQNTDHVGGNTYEKLPQGNKDRFLKVLEYASMSPQLNSEYSSIGIYIKKSSTNGLDRGPIFLKSLASKALTAKFNNREKKVYITTLKMYYSGTTEDGKGIVFTRGIGISAEMGLSIIKCENTTDPKQKDAHVKLEKTDDRCKFDYIIPKSVYENLLGNKKSDEFEIKLTFEKDAQETAEFNFVLKIEFDQKRLSVKEPGELKVHNGSTLDPVVIQIYDANDIISQNTDGDRVSVTVFNSEGQQEKAVINGNKLVTIKNGEAIFTDLSVQGNVGATYTLVFKAQLDGKVTSVTKDIAILPPRPNLAPIPKIIDIVKVKGGSSDDFSQTLYKIVFDKEVKFEEGKAVDSSSADRLIHTPMPDSRSNELYFTHLVIGGHNAKTFKLNLFNGATIRSIGGIDADLSYAVKLADPPKVSVKFNNNKPNTFTWEWSSVNGNSVVYRYRKQGETSWTDAQQGQTSYELKDANGIQTLYVQEQDEQGDWSLSGFAKGIIPKIQVVEYSYQPDPNKRKLEIKIDPMVREGLNFSFVMSVDIENAKQIDAYYDGFGGSHLIGVANVALAKESDWPEVKKISTKSMTFGPHHFGPADTTWTYMNPNQCYRLAIQQQANEAVLPTTDFKLNVLNDNNKEKNTVKIHLFKNFDETKISLKKNQGMFGKANIDNYGNFVYSIDQDINEDFFVSKKDKFTFVLKNNGNSCEFYATVTLFSDPLYGRQWHHKNLKVEPVHNDGITGKGVTVAVLDSGLNTEHKDLKDNIILNGAWEKNTDGKVVWTDELRPRDGQTHGTNVAVILGAIGWNNLGGRGIAPSVKLKGINLIDEVYTEALINGLGYDGKLADVDIFNLSFGLGPISQNKSFKDQLWKSVLNFRNGKGAIYVKASGNSYKNHMSPYTASSCPMSEKHNLTCENTAFDLLNNHPAIINVAALTLKDVATSFSTQGAANWVSAPGEYVLIDANSSKELVSVSEDLNIDHMSSKNVDGTSFSSPMVTGVVALMLEANPALTWREVKHILAATARKVDNKNRVRRQVTVDGIDVEPGWITNKAGYHFHNAYGFGAVDADAAVKMAKGYHQRPEQLGQFNKDQYKELGGDIDEALKPNDLKTIRVKQANKGKIETLIVTIKLKDFFFPSDLSIALVSPSKTRSVLLSPFNALSKINDVLELSTNAFYGEEMQGDWEIQIYDHLEDNSNTFEYRTEFQKGIISLIKFTPELGSWKLKFYGSTAVPEKSNNF